MEVTHPPLKIAHVDRYNEFARWRHSAPFWRHHNYISYLLWRWPLLSSRVGFSYIVRIICDGLCTLSKYRFWILIVCGLLPYTKHLHLVAPLVPKSVTSYSISPLASLLFRWFLRSPPFFTCDAYCIARPCYGFLSVLLSVHPSVSHKVCPRRHAVSLRQLSFLFIFSGNISCKSYFLRLALQLKMYCHNRNSF